MQAKFVAPSSADAFLDPSNSVWKRAAVERLKLEGTPLALQPTALIVNTWANRKIGTVGAVQVAAVHDGSTLALRLEWDDPIESVGADNTDFPDGAAVLFPVVPNAPLPTMGAPGMAVNAWYWRSDDDQGRHVVAEGIGTSRTLDLEQVRARGSWKDGRWRVVIARALRVGSPEPVAQLRPGEATGVAVAVWDGANGERGGIKAYSGALWQEFEIDAAQSARS